ncbi:DUF421 domain-containing protein [Hymenobacter arizonensis]|uniref:YetF C-terminal domain-containing protein n=1 Tax=Hymenobacter arizonensis TaxID=1227077 RepID=A0A1I5Z782_HYMAR|nr:YetF domain-containing protein [Hymenobacter arizonensis]SFQ52205.1 Protein of unknown function [Hymenobacter arizonensis]
MKKEEIYLGDWQRILLGNAPLEFMLEVVLRTLLIYLVLLVAMRQLGKRMNAQLTVTELAVMIMLGGIVSVAMQVPERGLLHSAFTLGCMLALNRGINWLAFRYRRVEYITQGDVAIVAKDGVLDLDAMAQANLSREQLFGMLRADSVRQLGQVKRVYVEANGEFSIYRQQPARPGLSVLPDTDARVHDDEPAAHNLSACRRCGHPEPADHQLPACPRCGWDKWAPAVHQIEEE